MASKAKFSKRDNMQIGIKNSFWMTSVIALPRIILERFDQVLREKALPNIARFIYTKWLRFYWDFCQKYQHNPLYANCLPLFLKNLQDKQQSEQQQQEAHQALFLVLCLAGC
jgi:hypothetical protein